MYVIDTFGWNYFPREPKRKNSNKKRKASGPAAVESAAAESTTAEPSYALQQAHQNYKSAIAAVAAAAEGVQEAKEVLEPARENKAKCAGKSACEVDKAGADMQAYF